MQASLAPQDEAPDQSPPQDLGCSQTWPISKSPALPTSGAILPSAVNILLDLLLCYVSRRQAPRRQLPSLLRGDGHFHPIPTPRHGVWGGRGAREKGNGGDESPLWHWLLMGSVCHRRMLPEQFGFQGNSVKVCGLLPAPGERETHVIRSPSSPLQPSQGLPARWGPSPEACLRHGWRGGRGALHAGQGPAGPVGWKEGGLGPGVRTKPCKEASSTPSTPTLSRPRPQGGPASRAGSRPAPLHG